MIRAAARWLAVLLVLGGCGGGPPPRRPAPALVLPALDGGEVALRAYRGRVVVLHFFTTWSMAAEADIDQLVEALGRHGARLVIIGIALDPGGHRLVAPWRQARGVRYLVALGTDELRSGATSLGRIGVPTTVVIDTGGNVVARIDGPLPPGRLDELLTDL